MSVKCSSGSFRWQPYFFCIYDTGEDVAVAVFGKPFYSLQCREGLESELGQETVMVER